MAGCGVAITGLGCITPLGVGAAATWAAAKSGQSGVSALPPEFAAELPELPELPVRIAARCAAEVDAGLTPKDARRLDRVIILALAAVREALQNAGLQSAAAEGGDGAPNFDGARCGVSLGTGIGGIGVLLAQQNVLMQKGPRRVSPFCIPLAIANMPAGMAAITHGLRGPLLCQVTACAAGAQSIGEAARALQRGDADCMVAGGTEAAIHPLVLAGFANMQALSRRNDAPQAASRPFDSARDGFVLGEGAGALVLERAQHARARGARILGWLRGYGTSADAAHMTAPDPSGAGAARAMQAALRDAQLQPADVGAVNAHATSTPAGDEVEARALHAVFGAHTQALPVSATKGGTGHLLGAAGAVEAILTLRALAEGVLPPTLNLDKPDAECNLDHVAGAARAHRARYALSNSFGFGGVNAALLFERGEV